MVMGLCIRKGNQGIVDTTSLSFRYQYNVRILSISMTMLTIGGCGLTKRKTLIAID